MRKIKGSPQPFGVDIKGKNINFAVQVAKGKTCELLLYKRGKEVPEYAGGRRRWRSTFLIC
mgnify:CR=1 FL=1